jgi:hypothetical protein
MRSVDRLIAVAEQERGYREGPNNKTKYGKWFDPRFEHVMWCDMFVSWCADQVGLSKVVGRFALTRTHANWFKSHDRWSGHPHRGAIVFFHMPTGHPGINHVGIVERVLDDGGIVTIEGNAGDKVARVTRRAHIVGYGHPDYPDDNAKIKTEVPPFPLPTGWWYGPASAGPHSVTGTHGPASYRDGLKTWQRRMLVRGWTDIGKPEGVYNQQTAKVARQFQEEKHLHVDGGIGIETWKAAWTAPITA